MKELTTTQVQEVSGGFWVILARIAFSSLVNMGIYAIKKKHKHEEITGHGLAIAAGSGVVGGAAAGGNPPARDSAGQLLLEHTELTAASRLQQPAAAPRTLVLVLGETARADHFQLNQILRGYRRRFIILINGLSSIAQKPCIWRHKIHMLYVGQVFYSRNQGSITLNQYAIHPP